MPVRLFFTLGLALWPGALAWAADPASPAPGLPPVIEVTVRGVPPVPRQAGGDFKLPIGKLAEVPRRSAESLLTLAPGLLLTTHGGQFHASSIFLRGFDAGEGQDLEFTIDGVPINEVSNPHGHGYADTHFLIARLVSSLQVIEGPFDPRQGDFAVAGSARFELGLAQRGVSARAGYGSFDRRQLTLLWGPGGHGPGTFVGVEFEDGDGFGPNRAFAAARMMARHEWNLSPTTRLAVLATSYGNRFDTAGVIRRDDYEARRLPCGSSRDEQFFCVYDTNQGGAGARHGLVLSATSQGSGSITTATAFLTLRDLRLRQNFTGFTTDVGSAGLPQRGDGVEQRYGALTIGSRGSYRFAPLHTQWVRDFEVGYLARFDDGVSIVRRLRTVGGIPYRVDANDTLAVSNIGGYAGLRLSPLRRLNVSGGLRVDGFFFAVTDQNRPASDRVGSRLTSETTEAYGHAVQPKLGLDLSLGRGLSALLAAGVGTRSSYAQALSAGEVAPFARVQAAEAGLVWQRPFAATAEMEARLLTYFTHLDRDLLFDEGAGRNILVGASNRFGSTLALRAEDARGFDLLGSVTYAEAYLPPPEAQGWAFTKGVRLPYVPRWVARLDGSWERPLRLQGRRFVASGALGFTYVGPRPLPFAQASPALTVLDLAARVAAGPVQVGLEITNLFDRRNREAVYNYASNFRGPEAPASLLPQQHFSAGAPRALFFTLAVVQTP
ncbi:MAG: TonB-dependent receptor [Myxococcales bacterium]|nr:TonB-dependent receptor [Myxococcales bacterium]